MNKKLISLAVAAALVAPAAAMAEAVLYGKLNVSLDYVDVTSAILPFANNTAAAVWVRNGAVVAANTPGATQVAARSVGGGADFTGWGMANGYVPSAVTYSNIGATWGGFLPPGIGLGATTVVPPVIGLSTVTGLALPLAIRSAGGGRANRLGVKGSEDLGGGLKAVYQIEFGINPTDTNSNVADNADTIAMRNTFVGLAGGWGTALMGRHDTPLKISTGKLDFFADTLADMNATVGFHDVRADNAVAYVSPAFSGFTFAAAIVPTGGATVLGQTNTEADAINTGWSIAGIYSNGPFYASAAYESLGYNLFNNNNINNGCLQNAVVCATSDNDWNKWRLGLGLLDWNGFSLSAMYESQSGIPGADAFLQGAVVNANGTITNWVLPGGADKQDMWQIQAGYAFGNSMVKAMYGASGFDSDSYVANPTATALQLSQQNDIYNGDRQTWAVGFDHNFSKRTKVYALYTDVSDDRSDWIASSAWSGFSLGMMHSF